MNELRVHKSLVFPKTTWRISRETGISEQEVLRHLAALQEKGCAVRVRGSVDTWKALRKASNAFFTRRFLGKKTTAVTSIWDYAERIRVEVETSQ